MKQTRLDILFSLVKKYCTPRKGRKKDRKKTKNSTAFGNIGLTGVSTE